LTGSSKEETLKEIIDLISQATEEEQVHHYDKTIILLEKAEKISSKNELKEKQGLIYFKLGEIYFLYGYCGETKEENYNAYSNSLLNFNKACKIFKEIKMEDKLHASIGYVNIVKYFKSDKDEIDKIDKIKSSNESFKKSIQLSLNKGDEIFSLNMEIMEHLAQTCYIIENLFDIEKYDEFEDLYTNYKKNRILLKDKIEKQVNLSEIYFYWAYWSFIIEFSGISPFAPDRIFNFKAYIDETINASESFLKLFKDTNKFLKIGLCNLQLMYNYTEKAIFFTENQFEQKKYLLEAQKWAREYEKLIPKFHAFAFHSSFYAMRYCSALFLAHIGFISKDLEIIFDDMELYMKSISGLFPESTAALSILYQAAVLDYGAHNRSALDSQRIELTKKAIEYMDLGEKEISVINHPYYKIYNLFRDVVRCSSYGLFGDLLKDEHERMKCLKEADFLFQKTSNYEEYSYLDNSFFYYNVYLFHLSRVGIILAENSTDPSKKIHYYDKTLALLLQSEKLIFAHFHFENLFLIGDLYFELGRLKSDEDLLNKSYYAYENAIEYCLDKGYNNLVGSGHVNLAKIEDRLGNFHAAADHYEKAIESFNIAMETLTHTGLNKKIAKLLDYMKAWKIIELAKSYHVKEDHEKARCNYEKAIKILENIKGYKFEAPFYTAWAILEAAEDLSKNNQHVEAAMIYLKAKDKFEESIEILKGYMGRRKFLGEKDRISKLTQVAAVRVLYCTARNQIENARLEGKKGNHEDAANLYNKAADLFEKLCQKYKIRKEKGELTAEYYLCLAWESMERAEKNQDPELHAKASILFEKASKLYPESKMKKLALGNSLYCSALEAGNRFDSVIEIQDKILYYKKIKSYLRESSKNYKMGGFEQDSQWALATSTFFDGVWSLIQSDHELDLAKKHQNLELATKYLTTASHIFEKAGYSQKKDTITNYMEMISEEQAIHASALLIIEKPAISISSVGISAPSCPIEISSPVDIDEMHRNDMQAQSEASWRERIQHVYLFKNESGIIIHDYSFRPEEEIEPNLVSGSLTGINMLIQEITKNETKVKIIEQEDMTILLEHGKYITAALISEDNLMTLKSKLKDLVTEVEDFYQEELENFGGVINPFKKAGKFTEKIFEN